MRLADAVKFLLCNVANAKWLRYRCKCKDPLPRKLYCAYGHCVIVECALCNKYINFSVSDCFYPYTLKR